MALVMLPCDMPWWPTLQKHLESASNATNKDELLPAMEKIISLCNVGLDDCEETEVSPLPSLEKFITEDMNDGERTEFFQLTLPSIAKRALDLKKLRPPSGLHFSLQQQCDKVEFERDFLASLLAHAFFSTFPKRTSKTHPTLLDFNFTSFFLYLNLDFQKNKFRSFLHYFITIDKTAIGQKIGVSRQVLTGDEWLTLEDWISCRLPLCQVHIKRQGRLSDAPSHYLRTCSVSQHIGSGLLEDGHSIECTEMSECPETMALLLFVEALEDNEALIVESVLQVSLHSPIDMSLSLLHPPILVNLCLMDAEDYSMAGDMSSLLQYQEDCLLREVNKALTGFRQGRPASRLTATLPHRRLSPIGESFSSTPASDRLPPRLPSSDRRRHGGMLTSREPSTESTASARRRFIVLGSSGECLPVSRSQNSSLGRDRTLQVSSAHDRSARSPSRSSRSISPEYFSARSSLTDPDELEPSNVSARKAGKMEERSSVFAQRLKEALDRAERAESNMSECRWGREGSCGFVLDGESEKFQERKYMAPSSVYSFSTDYGSIEVDGWCEEVGRWLEEDEIVKADTMAGQRQEAVLELAGTLMKRTLSETWAGVPLPGGDPPPSLLVTPTNTAGGVISQNTTEPTVSTPVAHPAPRSLSLELAKNRLKAHIVCAVLDNKDEMNESGSGTSSFKPVATSNWGCCPQKQGEPQLKLLIQWMAASVALIPHLVYFTQANALLNKVDTLCRVVVDRQWSVGELAAAIVSYSSGHHSSDTASPTLFETIISQEDHRRRASYRF